MADGFRFRNGTPEHFGRAGLSYFVMLAPGWTYRTPEGIVIEQQEPQVIWPYHTQVMMGEKGGGRWAGY